MKYVSIDIETTGLDRDLCKILSIGAVIEDTNNPLPLDELPTFHCAILRDSFHGEFVAINMNAKLIETITRYKTSKTLEEKKSISIETGMRFLREDEVLHNLAPWLLMNGIPADSNTSNKIYITVAGKNFATFDKVFLEKLPRWRELISIRQRIIDPSILFTDWESDESLPSLLQCKQRAGISGEVTHNAVEDAMDVIQILRTQYVTPKNK